MPKHDKKKDSVKVKRGQQLPDDLARKVSRSQMTYANARKLTRERDSIASRITKVGKKVSGSSENTTSKRKYHKAKFKLDKYGNKVAY